MITMKVIEIGWDIKIGDDQRPFMIAEVGSNWRTLEDCFYAIRMAKWSGANAVKFQLFDHHALYGSGDGKTEGATPMYGAMPREWIPKLAEHAKIYGIEFMCSAFSPELLDLVDPYVRIHKVASAEMYHAPLLKRLALKCKPVIMSTAASHIQDIKRSLGAFMDSSGALQVPVIILYCIGSYPAKDIDLRCIELLRKQADCLAGYSDHSIDVRVINFDQAVRSGACVIEKHFNALDPLIKTPDSEHSLNPKEFKTMVNVINGVNDEPYLGPTPNERDMVMRHKRRIKCIKDIKTQDLLIEGTNIGSYRSLTDDCHAFSPFNMDEVHGKFAKKDIKVGEGIGPGDF